MDKSIEQIFKAFTHVARELQIYFLSGFLVLANCILLDFLFFNSSLLFFASNNKLIVPACIMAYIGGHFLMGICYTLFELTGFESWIKKKIGLKKKLDTTALPKIYSKDKGLYSHFVERYVLLSMMRSTLTAGSLVIFIIDIISIFYSSWKWQLSLITIISFIAFLTFLLLTCRTDEDYARRIDDLKD